ncbi:MAG TPA: glycosyltransferase family 1 protein [Pirellulales bacterium]|nr:glycosyltransferase family 1 protein [Pirellulales bacterium]
MIYVNTRCLSTTLTGVQRYLLELLRGDELAELRQIAPSKPLRAMRGHAWEQFSLPWRCRGGLLWSPSNTGPLAVSAQVLTLHDVIPMEHPEWMNPKFAAWYQFLTPKIARRVRHIITVSEFSKSRILHHCDIAPEKVTVVYAGVDDRFFSPDDSDAEAFKQRLGIPFKRYVLSLGSLEPRKNLNRLLQAWQRIEADYAPDVGLAVVGAKGASQIFGSVEFTAMPKNIVFLGHVDDRELPALYRHATCFAFCSMYEGFGSPPVEAMAAGTPVLIGQGTALSEVGGDAVLAADPLSIDAMEHALRRLLDDANLRSDLIAKGKQRATQFTYRAARQKTRAVLNEQAMA